MIEINFNKVTKDFGYGKVLDNISFEIKTGEIVAIVGANGEGKSTILNLINKDEVPTSGEITIRNGSKIGYLKQIVVDEKDLTVRDILDNSVKEIKDIEEKLLEYELKMEKASNEELNKLIIKYTNLQDKFINMDGYLLSKRIGKVVNGFKLNDILDTKYNSLSGGEKRIVSLAAIMLKGCDILLLDEPTNHLDIKTLEWFESYLKSTNMTVLIVSHDRYFLDKVTDKIIYLDRGSIDIYFGNYTYFEEEKEKRLMNEFATYKTYEKKVEAMKEAIKRLKEYGRRADPEGGMFFRRAASIEKRLEKMEVVEKPKENKALKLDFSIEKRTGEDVLTIKKKDLYIKDTLLIKRIFMNIYYQDKVCILGDNGTGKSTLIKHLINVINGEIDDTIKIGSNVKYGYIPQEIVFDNENDTIFEYTRRFYLDEDDKLRSALFHFHFFGDEINKKIVKLSGGEKVRLKLFELIERKANFLILDEPTNHIDIETRTVLEDALKEYKGTLLFVSHDRYFINKVANKVYAIDNNEIKLYLGNYDYYKEKVGE